jgi:hypothetical protein
MFPENGCRSSNCDDFHTSLYVLSVTIWSTVTRSWLFLFQLDGLRRWGLSRQISGFQGRPNKEVDTCYSFWLGALLKVRAASLIQWLQYLKRDGVLTFCSVKVEEVVYVLGLCITSKGAWGHVLFRLVLKGLIFEGNVYLYLERLEAELCAYFFRDRNFYEGHVVHKNFFVDK